MCACQSTTSISGSRNSGLSRQTSEGTGHPRRHSSLVGTRLLRQEMAPKIAETVANLVEQGFLEEKPSPDGQTFYHVSKRYLSVLQLRPRPSSTPDATP